MTGNELIVDYLTSVPAWYLATVEDTPEGAQPHVRPFSFAALQDGEIQFCTATTKDCYREMQANPRVELTAWKPGRGWIILRGRANLEDRANATVREALNLPLINWSLNSNDWETRDADRIYNDVMNNIQDGDIVLFHDLKDFSASAIERIVPALTKQGYQLVTVQELFELKGRTLEPGVLYSSRVTAEK